MDYVIHCIKMDGFKSFGLKWVMTSVWNIHTYACLLEGYHTMAHGLPRVNQSLSPPLPPSPPLSTSCTRDLPPSPRGLYLSSSPLSLRWGERANKWPTNPISASYRFFPSPLPNRPHVCD